jgi:hypothetical protein
VASFSTGNGFSRLLEKRVLGQCMTIVVPMIIIETATVLVSLKLIEILQETKKQQSVNVPENAIELVDTINSTDRQEQLPQRLQPSRRLFVVSKNRRTLVIKKTATTLLTIAGEFFILNILGFVQIFLTLAIRPDERSAFWRNIDTTCITLGFFNYSFNFIFYFASMSQFRVEVKHFFRACSEIKLIEV